MLVVSLKQLKSILSKEEAGLRAMHNQAVMYNVPPLVLTREVRWGRGGRREGGRGGGGGTSPTVKTWLW